MSIVIGKGKTGTRQNISDNKDKYYDLQRNGDIVLRRNSDGKVLNTYKVSTSANKNILKKRFTDIYRQKYGTNNNSSNNSNSNTNSVSFSSSNDEESSDDDKSGHWETVTEEVECETLIDALRFARTYMNKALRNDGHSIDVKTIGSPYWKVGEWCKVEIPTFEEDCTMFITKISSELSASDENIISLTLVDYPPSLSKGVSNSPNNSLNTSSENGESVTNDDGTTTTTYSDGSSVTTDSNGNTTSVTGSNNSKAMKSIKLGKNKKMVTASARVDGERYITVVQGGKVQGYIHLNKDEVKTVLDGSGQTKLPTKSSLSNMKKGERYKQVHKNGKVIKLIWVPKNYKGAMHIYL